MVIELTKRPLARERSKVRPAMFNPGTNATADPRPAIAKIVDKNSVSKKYIKYSNNYLFLVFYGFFPNISTYFFSLLFGQYILYFYNTL